MPPKLYLLFSHKLTEDQQKDARSSFEIADFIYLPGDLQKLWSNVPPEIDSLSEYLQPLFLWLKSSARKGDYVLIQGDYGATYSMVNWAFLLDLIPIYGTTKRQTKETHLSDKVHVERVISHEQFRLYEKTPK